MRRNKRGLELAISTLVIIVIAVLILIALVLAFTGSWSRFIENIRGYSGTDVDNLSKICQNDCNIGNEYGFCCAERILGKKTTSCRGKRLNVECDIDCEGVCGIRVI